MRRIVRSAVLALAISFIATAPAAAQRYPDEPGDGIADLAGVLSPADAAGIRAIIGRMRATPGVEVAVLTVRNVAAYGAASPEAFATGVYNHWRLGYGQRQDGVLVLLSLDDRFTRIELGDGVPADQDAKIRTIVDGVMVPRFRDGDMSGGLHDGVLAVANAFGTQAPAAVSESGAAPSSGDVSGGQAVPPSQTTPLPQPVFTPADRAYGGYSGGGELSGGALAALLIAGVLLVGVCVWIYRQTRRRNCAQCGIEAQRLDEQADDVYLDSGRRLEEVMDSVNYTVWKCPGCGNHEIQRSARWFSGKSDCPQCSYRTVSTKTRVLQHPTYDHGGTQRVERDCAHCHWHDVDTVHLPRKVRPAPSSSSSSSRSSFSSGGSSSGSSSRSSGGSSSGRGSSGRW